MSFFSVRGRGDARGAQSRIFTRQLPDHRATGDGNERAGSVTHVTTGESRQWSRPGPV